MAVYTVKALDDVDSVWTASAGSHLYQMIWHGFSSVDDSQYISSSTNTTQSFRLPGVPIDWDAITQVRVRLRHKSAVLKGTSTRVCSSRIYQENGTTALTNASSNTTVGSSFTDTYFTLTITGGTGRANWDNAVIKLTTSGSAGIFYLSEMEVEYTYNESSMSDGFYKNRDPIGHWLWRPARHTNTGDVIRDYTSANDGEIVGSPTVDFSSRGPVYDLDIADTYIKIPASKDLTFTDGSNDKSYSIALWFKTTDIQYVRMVHKGSEVVSGTSEATSYGVEYYLATSNNTLYFQCFDATTTGAIRAYKTLDSSYENRWVHLVGTYDGSALNTGMNIYIDGLPATSVSRANIGGASYSSMRDTGGNITIGALLAASSSTYDDAGQFQDVRIYGCELAAAEVKELYSNTKRDPRFATRKRSFSYAAILGEEDDPPASTSNPQAFALFVDF